MKKLISFFLQGLLFIGPIAVSVFVIFKIFDLVDGLLRNFLPWEIPGLGLLIILVLITGLGWLGSTIIAKPMFSYFDKVVEKAPLIKIIYTAVKDLLSAFVGSKKSFNQPVLVKLEKDSDVQKLGFITQSDLSDLGIGKDKVAVYLPHSYAWSGNQYIVPKANVQALDVSAATVMKFIVSGGVTSLENNQSSDNE
ncbi:MAG TPA: DUF502 domain-containing protein [Flavobacteriales bacterium]|nr:DUF502 domain-containing protein [Flavobacteriales bacterium]HIA12892.1 DUF502 domain-containing protein [Flavobacteriales bacterium]